MEDVPMSDELKTATMQRESKEAMTDLIEEIEDDLVRLRKVIAEFKEDSDTAVVGFIIATLAIQSLHDKAGSAIRRFQRRVKGLL